MSPSIHAAKRNRSFAHRARQYHRLRESGATSEKAVVFLTDVRFFLASEKPACLSPTYAIFSPMSETPRTSSPLSVLDLATRIAAGRSACSNTTEGAA